MLHLLRYKGRGFIEIGYNQREKIESKLSNTKDIQISWINDFANVPRILELEKMQSITNLNLDPLFGIATDTLWGLACRASDRKSVARIFELKKEMDKSL